MEDCPDFDVTCSSCISGQVECQNTSGGELNNLVVGEKLFEVISLVNSSIPPIQLPEYPFPVDYPAEMIFDEQSGVIRACGGPEPTAFASDEFLCFTFDGLSWEPMTPLPGSWYPDRSSRFSIHIPNVGWLMLQNGCSGTCTHSYIFTVNSTWIPGPDLPDPETYGYSQIPYNFCGVQLNRTHTMVSGGRVTYDGTSISDVWLFDWERSTWLAGPNMTTPRRSHTCTSLPGGSVMVAGGTGLFGEHLISTEIFDQAMDGGRGGWYTSGNLPEDDHYDDNALLFNGNPIWINRKKIWKFLDGEWSLFETSLENYYVSRTNAVLVSDDFVN